MNLGNIFGEQWSIGNAPIFKLKTVTVEPQSIEAIPEKLHVALVKLRNPQSLDDETMHGVGRTLTQLSRLGMSCCVVVDVGPCEDEIAWRELSTLQADRLSAAIDENHGPDSRRLDSLIQISSTPNAKASVLSRNQLISPLRQGHIVVVVPLGYTEDTQKAVSISSNDVVLALTKELAGLKPQINLEEHHTTTASRVDNLQKQVSLDRIIVLDPAGGIPSLQQRPHVFVNLEQEYDDLFQEVSQVARTSSKAKNGAAAGSKMPVSTLGKSNPISQFVEEEVVSLPRELARPAPAIADTGAHLDNLILLQKTLSFLPPFSSGIIVTPHEVAVSDKRPESNSSVSAVGTRRQRNPLIHNLLTDKPIHSASLPLSRLGVKNGSRTSMVHSTFVKRGMPLTMLPDPRVKIWTPKNHEPDRLTLDDPRIDLARLVHLIEDSFDRKLDVAHYVERANKRLAGLIIAGEYEGGAILTWELPPGVPDDGSEESKARMVPYLDKFAVLKRSQGAGGVADIIFNAMVRTCFPQGVCWRSRANNPVNKWYFERSRGTWKLPGTNWTMFWTTESVPENQQRFWDYEGVCRSIEPSWADNKQQVD